MSTSLPRIYLSPPHMSGNELALVSETFASNWIAPLGPMVDGFEADMCAYTGAAYAAALASGSSAIHLALQLCGVTTGDEVICSSFTFAGSCFPITYCNATPVFVDSEASSWNMDPVLLEAAITDRIAKGKRVAAVIVVHLYGQSADLDPIVALCAKYSIPLIEDAAESLGTLYKNRHTGTFGRFGIFSFNGNKIITTSGGGMLVGHNETEIKRATFLATQARENMPYYEHETIGYNYRMSNVVAAIGRGQLTVIEDRVARKRAIFETYRLALGSLPGVSFMPEPLNGRANRWLTCITINPDVAGISCDTVRLALHNENIESRPLWKPMHLQPVFLSAPSYCNGVSEALFSQGLCLPSGTALTSDDLDRILSCIKKVFRV